MNVLPDYILLDNNVYPPASDTFALSDAISSDLETIIAVNPTLILEVGCGSGYISTSLAMALIKHGIHTFILNSDLNPYATLMSLDTAKLNNTNAYTDGVRGSLVEWTNSEFDVMIFNPPYIPCQQFDHICSSIKCCNYDDCGKKLIELSYNGGPDGNVTINKFLSTSLNNLSPTGLIYLLLEKQNNPGAIIKELELMGYIVKILLTRYCYNEVYTIIRICKY